MIKKTITYTDFNDETSTEDFYFHVSKSLLLDNLDLQGELEELQSMLEGEKRELKEHEIMEILKLVKRLIKLSYGVRSDDGKRFAQGPEIYAAFAESAAYDAILFELFETPEKAISFLSGILPKDLLAAAKEEIDRQEKGRAPQDHLPKAVTAQPASPVSTDEQVPFVDPVEEAQASTTVPRPETVEELEQRLAEARARQG